jgi:hypothetical protein
VILSDLTSRQSGCLTWTNLDVVGKQSVEEVDVGVAQHGEILVLLNRRLLHLEQTETFTQLSVPTFFFAMYQDCAYISSSGSRSSQHPAGRDRKS